MTKPFLCPPLRRVLTWAVLLSLTHVGLAAETAPEGASAKPSHVPVVIFKLDDLRDTEAAQKGFDRVFELLVAHDLKASFGVITDSCEDNGQKASYYALIKKWAQSGHVEIWHHGYTHKEGEFTGASYEQQREHLQKGCRLLEEKCGVELHSFGAPFNANDATTIKALNAVPQLSVWMYPRPGGESDAKQVLLPKRANMEPKTGVVSFDLFVSQFAANAAADYLVIQGHPPYWNEASHADFGRILDYCQKKGCRFMTAFEYAQTIKK